MKEIGRYDNDLQMFVEMPREVDMGKMRFLRWLGEQGRLEHQVAGPPTGALVAKNTPVDDLRNRYVAV